MKSRRAVLALLVVLVSCGAVVEHAAPAGHEGEYQRDNERLARSMPVYPRARVLIEEPIYGEAGTTSFEAVQGIYVLRSASTQARVVGFYRQQLGSAWHQSGPACLVSRRRAVAVVLEPRRRRLGVVIDSRGASYCREHVANIALLLRLGYPD
jgi:hypothetical protein